MIQEIKIMRQFIILILLLLIVYIVRKSFSRPPSDKEINLKEQMGEKMVKDPFCNLYIPEASAVKKIIRGETHFFCSNECAEKFENLRR